MAILVQLVSSFLCEQFEGISRQMFLPVLQRFYHQQNQLRERERERRLADKQFNLHLNALTSASGHNYNFKPNTSDGSTISPIEAAANEQSSKTKDSNASKEDQGRFHFLFHFELSKGLAMT